MKNLEFKSGELIEIYEDRWFFEPRTSTVKEYILLFKVFNGRPNFEMIDRSEVVKISITNKKKSSYKTYLKNHNIKFSAPIMENYDVLTGNHGHHKFERMFGNFAWDLALLDKDKKQFYGTGKFLEDYYIYDKEVFAPMDGVVIGKEFGHSDNPPDLTFSSNLDNKKNNFLTIKVKDHFYLSIVHFKKNSILVNITDQIKAGDLLGNVGNSGVSYLPHLHVTMYTYIYSLKRFVSIPALTQL